MARKLFFLLSLVTITIFIYSLLASEGLKGIYLGEVIKIALQENPEIKVTQKKYEAGINRIKSSSSLPDPWVGLEYQNIPKGTFKFGESEMKMYSFSQMIPWPNKLSLRAKTATISANISQEEYKAKQRQIIAQVKQAYYELYLAYKSIEITKENGLILEQMVKVAEKKYSVGKAGLEEVLKIQVELSKLNNNLVTLENQKKIAQTKLNSLLNRQTDTEIGTPQYQDNNEFNYNLDELYNLAKLNRPELNVARNSIKQSELALSLAKKEYLPDLMFTYKQRVMDGELMGWDGMVNITIPLWFWRNQNYMVKEMRTEKEMSAANYQAMENMVLFEIQQMYLKLDAALRQIKLYQNSIIPQAEQILKVSLVSYEANKLEFLDLLDSQRMYLEAEQEYYMSLADFQMAKAELEQMVGVDLEEVRK